MTSQLPRFWWVFFAAGSCEKDTKSGAAVTSLRLFLFRDDFTKPMNPLEQLCFGNLAWIEQNGMA